MSLDALFEQERLPASFRQVVEAVYVPLANRIAAEANRSEGTFVVGLCGAQGSGKSTVAAVLKVLLEAQGISAAVLSLDDLYLTRAERLELAARVHPLLATRGVPGTHEVELGLTILDALSNSGHVALPRFDKAADDRSEESTWPIVETPVRVVFFEGWCVGAKPQGTSAFLQPVNSLEKQLDADGTWRSYVNARLADVYQKLFKRIDYLVLLAAPKFEVVYAWRLEQERKLRERLAADAKPSRVMDEEQIALFIQHYERLTRHILEEMPSRADVVLTLDAKRRVTRAQGL
jgi:D-glycerate 3-kinase